MLPPRITTGTACSCNTAAHNAGKPTRTTFATRVRGMLHWALPGIGFVLIPKCPMCLAAYVALGTGISVSFATATYLRWALIVVCVGALVYLAYRRWWPQLRKSWQ